MRIHEYLPADQRTPDYQYQNILRQILNEGRETGSAHEERSKTILAPAPMRFDLRNGAPLITERSFNGIWRSSVGELLAFINGVHTLDGLTSFGVNPRFWDRWVTEKKCAKRGLPTGDMGWAYGPAFHDFPTPDGPFNQIQHVVEQIQELPDLRSHRVCNWIPQYQVRGKGKNQKVVVTPCHGDMYFRVIGDELHLYMTQHKADVVVGVPSNMIQYAALLLAMAHVTGYKPGEFIHALVDAHIYYAGEAQNEDGSLVSQMEAAEEITQRKPLRFPKLELTPDAPDNIFDFRVEHFVLSEYEHHANIKGIGTAI